MGSTSDVARSRYKSMHAVAAIAGLLTVVQCPAETKYRLVEGMGYTVCEAFLRNLNSFPPSDPPMICRQKLRPGDSTFTELAWENLDVERNLHLVYAAESLLPTYTRAGRSPPTYDEWLKNFRERIQKSGINPRLSRALVGLADRRVETVIGYEPEPGACERLLKKRGIAAVSDGKHMFVLTSNEETPLQEIAGASWLPRQVLVYQGRGFLLGSGNDYEHRGTESLHVWNIRLGPVVVRERYDPHNLEAPAFDGYAVMQRCSINVTLE